MQPGFQKNEVISPLSLLPIYVPPLPYSLSKVLSLKKKIEEEEEEEKAHKTFLS